MADAVVHTRGYVALTGPSVVAAAQAACASAGLSLDSSAGLPHVTLFTKEELRALKLDNRTLLASCDTRFVSLGVGGRGGASWAVLVWPGGALLRHSLGCASKCFHITLSAEDDHTAAKGVSSLRFHRSPLSPAEASLALSDPASPADYGPDYAAPTLAQVDAFIDTALSKRTLVHCGGGKGRAGTFVACYLAASGFGGDRLDQPAMSAALAIQTVRRLRPGSVETEAQEQFVAQFVSHLWKAAGVLQEACEEPEDVLELRGRFPAQPRLVLCCGLPGSGKSSFSTALCKQPARFVRVSQDELGSRDACLSLFARSLKARKSVVVDRCNPDAPSRKLWLAEAAERGVAAENILCVFFDLPAPLCAQRADARAAHPTVKQGRGAAVVSSMGKLLQAPSLAEGVACIARVRSIRACAVLLAKLGAQQSAAEGGEGEEGASSGNPPPNASPPTKLQLHKFPRTRHILSLGAATRDDLIMTPADANAFLSASPGQLLVVQEKVDGANLGVSIDPATLALRAQNRSHFVNSASHLQFKGLQHWLEEHREALWPLLSQGGGDLGGADSFGRFVLFGEWCSVAHSIHYVQLPDVFVAFDLYDSVRQRFLSSQRLRALLEGTGISMVRDLLQGSKFSSQQLAALVDSPSQYYDGPVEGVYVRKDEGEWLIDRAKIVRADFLVHPEGWTKGKTVYNETVRSVHV